MSGGGARVVQCAPADARTPHRMHTSDASSLTRTPPPHQIADFLKEVVDVASEVQASTGAKLIKDFTAALEADGRIVDIRRRVEAFSGSFPMPGFPTSHLE